MSFLSRNDLCWCGSGKKFKKCHMEQEGVLNELIKKGFTMPPQNIIKTPAQIEGIRKSATLTKAIFDLVKENIRAGVTTNEINEWVHEYTIKNGGIPATLNFCGFPKSVCTSINNVICHGIPSETVLKDGDIVNVDVTTILDGYYSDASRMYTIGEISETAQKLVQCAEECLHIGIEAVKPFMPINVIGSAIEAHAKRNGFSIVKDFGGHGIGVEFHEDPHIHHFETREKGMIMVPGMVFTIEPMVNEGKYNCEILNDDWTVVTVDGSLSAQWEHTILVTETGVEIIT